jgi:hypothetical protein
MDTSEKQLQASAWLSMVSMNALIAERRVDARIKSTFGVPLSQKRSALGAELPTPSSVQHCNRNEN